MLLFLRKFKFFLPKYKEPVIYLKRSINAKTTNKRKSLWYTPIWCNMINYTILLLLKIILKLLTLWISINILGETKKAKCLRTVHSSGVKKEPLSPFQTEYLRKLHCSVFALINYKSNLNYQGKFRTMW